MKSGRLFAVSVVLFFGVALWTVRIRHSEQIVSAQTSNVGLTALVEHHPDKQKDTHIVTVRLVNRGSSAIVVDDFHSPHYGTAMVLIAPKLLWRYEDVEGSFPIEDPSGTEKTLAPGAEWTEDVDLDGLYPTLREVLKKSDVVLFWTYQLNLVDGPHFDRQGGWLLIPKSN